MLSTKDMLVLGMMVFALFLVLAILFSPYGGFSIETSGLVHLRFLVTGVLLPFLTLVIVAIRGRGERLSSIYLHGLPSFLGSTVSYRRFYFCDASRVTNTAYEMGFLPLGLVEKYGNTPHFRSCV